MPGSAPLRSLARNHHRFLARRGVVAVKNVLNSIATPVGVSPDGG